MLRTELNNTLSSVLTPMIDVPHHLQSNQLILDYVDQEIASVKTAGGTWTLDKANYYTKNQIDVLFTAEVQTYGNGLTLAEGNILKLGGNLTEETKLNLGGKALIFSGVLGAWTSEVHFAGTQNYIQYKSGYNIYQSFGQANYGTLIETRYDDPENGHTLYSGRLEFMLQPNANWINRTTLSYNHSGMVTSLNMDYNGIQLTANSGTYNKGLAINTLGDMTIHTLTGTGIRMVVAGADGKLSTQAIPTSGGSSSSYMPFLKTSVGVGLTDEHHFVAVDCSSGDLTIALPTAEGRAGKAYEIKKLDATAGRVVIQTTAQMIDNIGQHMFLTYQNEAIGLISDGSNWLIRP